MPTNDRPTTITLNPVPPDTSIDTTIINYKLQAWPRFASSRIDEGVIPDRTWHSSAPQHKSLPIREPIHIDEVPYIRLRAVIGSDKLPLSDTTSL